MLLGIHGKKRTGKTTVAGVIASLLPYTDVHVMAFADKLKELCHVAFDTPYKHFHDQALKEVAVGFNGMTPRDQMISLSDLMKNAYGQDYFVNVVEHQIANARKHLNSVPIVVSDVRYHNEASMIRENGGKIIHVFRETGEYSDHSSEAGIPHMMGDYVINNNGSYEALRQEVKRILHKELRDTNLGA